MRPATWSMWIRIVLPKPGGMWWGLQPDGVSPPIHTAPIFVTAPRHKEAYGQVQALFSLVILAVLVGRAINALAAA